MYTQSTNHPGTKKNHVDSSPLKVHIKPQDGAVDEYISHKDGTNIKPPVPSPTPFSPHSKDHMMQQMDAYLNKKPRYDNNGQKKFGV